MTLPLLSVLDYGTCVKSGSALILFFVEQEATDTMATLNID
jgi:hypothetical protein